MSMIPIHDDNPTHRTPIVTVALIVACVLAYLWQNRSDRAAAGVVYSFGFIPAVLFTDAALPPELAVVPAGVTLFTSMFLHGGFMHLAGNMLYCGYSGTTSRTSAAISAFSCSICCAAWLRHSPSSAQSRLGGADDQGERRDLRAARRVSAAVSPRPRARAHPLRHSLDAPDSAGWVLGFWFVFQLLSGLTADRLDPASRSGRTSAASLPAWR